MRQTTTAEVRLEQGKPPSSGPAVGQPIVSAAGMEPSRTKLFAAEHKKSDDIPHGTRNPGNVGYVCSLLLCKPIKAMILGRLRIGRLSSAVLEPRTTKL